MSSRRGSNHRSKKEKHKKASKTPGELNALQDMYDKLPEDVQWELRKQQMLYRVGFAMPRNYKQAMYIAGVARHNESIEE